MNKDKLQFKVHSLRTLSSPYSKEDKDESTFETIYYLLVNMNDLPDGISLEVNPRKPNMKTNVSTLMILPLLFKASPERLRFLKDTAQPILPRFTSP